MLITYMVNTGSFFFDRENRNTNELNSESFSIEVIRIRVGKIGTNLQWKNWS